MKFWRILLDSGSVGDIIFLRKNCKQKFPIKRQHEPQKWQTSAGTLKTDKVASVELLFLEYSHSKVVTVKIGVIYYATDDDRTNYDVIIGRHTMEQLGAVLDFKEKVIEWDGVTLPMKTLQNKRLQWGFIMHFNESPLQIYIFSLVFVT